MAETASFLKHSITEGIESCRYHSCLSLAPALPTPLTGKWRCMVNFLPFAIYSNQQTEPDPVSLELGGVQIYVAKVKIYTVVELFRLGLWSCGVSTVPSTRHHATTVQNVNGKVFRL